MLAGHFYTAATQCRALLAPRFELLPMTDVPATSKLMHLQFRCPASPISLPPIRCDTKTRVHGASLLGWPTPARADPAAHHEVYGTGNHPHRKLFGRVNPISPRIAMRRQALCGTLFFDYFRTARGWWCGSSTLCPRMHPTRARGPISSGSAQWRGHRDLVTSARRASSAWR